MTKICTGDSVWAIFRAQRASVRSARPCPSVSKTDGIRFNSICATLRDVRMAQIILKPPECRSTLIAGSEEFISLTGKPIRSISLIDKKSNTFYTLVFMCQKSRSSNKRLFFFIGFIRRTSCRKISSSFSQYTERNASEKRWCWRNLVLCPSHHLLSRKN